MNTRTATAEFDADSPLEALIKRVRRSKRMAGYIEPGQSIAAHSAYARLGRLTGR